MAELEKQKKKNLALEELWKIKGQRPSGIRNITKM